MYALNQLLFQIVLIALPINYGILVGLTTTPLFTMCMISSVFGIGLSILIISWVCTFKHGTEYFVGATILQYLHGIFAIGGLCYGIYLGGLSYLMVGWCILFVVNFPFYYLMLRYKLLMGKLREKNELKAFQFKAACTNAQVFLSQEMLSTFYSGELNNRNGV